MKRIYILLMIVTLGGIGCSNKDDTSSKDPDDPTPPTTDSGIKMTLCNPDASIEAQDVYTYLRNHYGQQIVSGTMANVAWNFDEAHLVQRTTGKTPKINCMDYIAIYGNWTNYSDISAIETWCNKGGIIGAGWHWMVPKDNTLDPTNPDNMTYKPDETTFRCSNALKAGTWENGLVKADLEKVADYLTLLANKNIAVLWRPLHEASGNIYAFPDGKAWFWWGDDGAQAYKALWKYMFEYFRSRGLNNLIWVWTSQTSDKDFYPGDEYVDLIGTDIYDELSVTKLVQRFNTLQEMFPDKMITLSECGSVAKISLQWQAGAKWSYFMPWYTYNATTLVGHDHADDQWWKDAVGVSITQ